MRRRAVAKLAALVGVISLGTVAAMLALGGLIERQMCYMGESREGSAFLNLIGVKVPDLTESMTGGVPVDVRHRRTGGEPGVIVAATGCAHPGHVTVYVSE